MSRESIAKKLKELREKSGMTANQVGELIGKSGKTVSAWENNHGQPDADTLIKLCDIYNVDDILKEFRSDSPSQEITLSEHEKLLITAYRSQQAMQPAVDRLLGIPSQPDHQNVSGAITDELAHAFTKNTLTKSE